MAERQSRDVTQITLHKVFTMFVIWSVLPLMLACYLQQARAENAIEYLAMGDIGAIKANFSDTSDAQQLTWAQLSNEQKRVLSALGGEWDTLRPWQREKMLDIARDYPKMDAEKQLRVQRRLNVWSRMTPYERENARSRYQQFHSLSPEKKDEVRKKWAEHEKLPEAQRERLRQGSDVYYDPDLD